MDVLRPQIVVVGNRCYRKNVTKVNERNTSEEEVLYTEDVAESPYNDEVCDAFSNVEKTDSGFKISMEVASAYYKFIIGKNGEGKKRIETETSTQVRIPKQGIEGDIVIIGHDRKGVLSAKSRIDVIIELARQKQPFTHFLSIPITGIADSFAKFKAGVLEECGSNQGLDQSLFQNPKKLHLTLGTLALMNSTEVTQALRVLQECHSDLIGPILKGESMQINIKGLEYMNDDPSAVDVLYAKVENESDRFQMLCDRVVDKFTNTGLMTRQYDRVKLHVTAINTLFRKETRETTPETELRGSVRNRESFNASDVLQKFGNYEFGFQDVTSIQLSQRYSTGQDGYYSSVGSIPVP